MRPVGPRKSVSKPSVGEKRNKPPVRWPSVARRRQLCGRPKRSVKRRKRRSRRKRNDWPRKKARAEQARIAEQKRLEQEKQRQEQERHQAEERRLAEEKKKADDARRAEEKRREEQEAARLAEKSRREAEVRRAEEESRKAQERQKKEQAARQAEERREAEAARRAAEDRHRVEEKEKREEEKRLAGEKAKAHKARLEEQKRLEREKDRQEKERRRAEARQAADERKKVAAVHRSERRAERKKQLARAARYGVISTIVLAVVGSAGFVWWTGVRRYSNHSRVDHRVAMLQDKRGADAAKALLNLLSYAQEWTQQAAEPASAMLSNADVDLAPQCETAYFNYFHDRAKLTIHLTRHAEDPDIEIDFRIVENQTQSSVDPESVLAALRTVVRNETARARPTRLKELAEAIADQGGKLLADPPGFPISPETLGWVGFYPERKLAKLSADELPKATDECLLSFQLSLTDKQSGRDLAGDTTRFEVNCKFDAESKKYEIAKCALRSSAEPPQHRTWCLGIVSNGLKVALEAKDKASAAQQLASVAIPDRIGPVPDWWLTCQRESVTVKAQLNAEGNLAATLKYDAGPYVGMRSHTALLPVDGKRGWRVSSLDGLFPADGAKRMAMSKAAVQLVEAIRTAGNNLDPSGYAAVFKGWKPEMSKGDLKNSFDFLKKAAEKLTAKAEAVSEDGQLVVTVTPAIKPSLSKGKEALQPKSLSFLYQEGDQGKAGRFVYQGKASPLFEPPAPAPDEVYARLKSILIKQGWSDDGQVLDTVMQEAGRLDPKRRATITSLVDRIRTLREKITPEGKEIDSDALLPVQCRLRKGGLVMRLVKSKGGQPFYIQVSEVSRGSWSAIADQTRKQPWAVWESYLGLDRLGPAERDSVTPPALGPDGHRPATGMAFQEATAFAQTLACDLPTPAQWSAGAEVCGEKDPKNQKSFHGSVWEWCRADPSAHPDKSVIVGGCWLDYEKAQPTRTLTEAVNEPDGHFTIGFRVMLGVPSLNENAKAARADGS